MERASLQRVGAAEKCDCMLWYVIVNIRIWTEIIIKKDVFF